MKRLPDQAMRSAFLAWQCRIRQVAMREHGGRPLPAMQARTLLRSGALVHPAMTVLIIPAAPRAATGFFRFQAQKTADPRKVYEAVLAYLQADHFSRPDMFRDELAAVFPAGSATAERLLKAKHCLLEFAQWGQTFRLLCRVRALDSHSPERLYATWHNRAFNPSLGSDATVLAFKPNWRSAQADPLPQEAAAPTGAPSP
jgi:hypothetical protein